MHRRAHFRACRMVAAAAGLAAGSGARAGGGPENVLVVIDPANAQSMHVGNYYRSARNIPDSNVLYYAPAAANHAAFAAANLRALEAVLAERGLDGAIDYIALAPGGPYSIPVSSTIIDGCSPVTRFSANSLYTMAFIAPEVLAGGLNVQTRNHYAANAAMVFRSSTAYLNGAVSTQPGSKRYYIGALLGYTGQRGNTLAEVLAMIDRSVAADGTRPAATFHFMSTTDPARNVRAGSYPGVAAAINAAGGTAVVLNGVLPPGAPLSAGIMTGVANLDIAGAGFTFAPGAFADHMTSYAAHFNNASQTKLSAWIAKGASGSVGAVEEPCNYTSKFPGARLHQFYFQGASLGEAYFRSADAVPFQMLFVGDPVTRMYAHIPTVQVPDAPTGPVGGVVTLTPTGSTTRPGTTLIQFDLRIDGASHGLVFPGQSFRVDTAVLADGWHDVRVLGLDSTPLRTQGRWLGALVVDNHGRRAALEVSPASGDLGTLFRFDASGSGAAVREVRLRRGGSVIAAAPGEAALEVHGQALGAGRSRVQAEVEFGDGLVARSEPRTVEVAATGGGAGEPRAFAYRKRARNDAPLLVELPATFASDPGAATYTVLAHPAQATLIAAGGPYALYQPAPNAAGLDALRFRVQTPAGPSEATVTIDFGGCYPDCDTSTGRGTLDIFDFLCFQNRYDLGDPYACDCDTSTGGGVCDIFDFLCFQNAYDAGCR